MGVDENNKMMEEEEEAETEYMTAKTSVWWDIETCCIPNDFDPKTIAENITSFFIKMKYSGPITIFAYGNIDQIPNFVQEALSSTGVLLNHLPTGVKDPSENKILVDMLCWAVDNPAPANYLLISGDRDFSYALHQLRMRNYNILLSQPQNASAYLVSVAKSVWLWTSILAGGPSLRNAELSQFGNSNGILSIFNSGQIKQSVDFVSESSSLQNHKCFCNGKGDDSIPKGKQIWRNSSEPNILAVGVQGQGNGSSHQPSFPQRKKFFEAPHEFFSANKLKTSLSESTSHPMPSDPDSSSNNGNSFTQNNLPFNFAPDHFFRRNSPTEDSQPLPPRQNGPSVIPSSHNSTFQQQHGEPKRISNLELLNTESFNISPNSQTVHNSPPFSHGFQNNRHRPHGSEFRHTLSLAMSANPIRTNGVWRTPGYPEPSEDVLGLIGIVLLALHTLKCEKMIPTEANITDCIRYGDPMHRDTDVRNALNYAIQQRMIVKQSVGAWEVYIGKNGRIWKCVNPMGGSPKQYPKAIWDEIQNYLSSPGGRSAMMGSRSRYEAAIFLKNSFLSYLALGDILQILNIVITMNKWIIVHPSGWQPISIALAEITTDAVTGTSI